MTRDEFLGSLSKTYAVEFEGSRISTPTEAAAGAIAGSLDAILPRDTTIRFGIQRSDFTEGTWQGAQIWLLVLNELLLEVTATASVDKKVDEMTAFHVRHRFIPLDEARATAEFTFPPKRGASATEVRITIAAESETITLASDRNLSSKGLANFLKEALAAIG